MQNNLKNVSVWHIETRRGTVRYDFLSERPDDHAVGILQPNIVVSGSQSRFNATQYTFMQPFFLWAYIVNGSKDRKNPWHRTTRQALRLLTKRRLNSKVVLFVLLSGISLCQRIMLHCMTCQLPVHLTFLRDRKLYHNCMGTNA